MVEFDDGGGRDSRGDLGGGGVDGNGDGFAGWWREEKARGGDSGNNLRMFGGRFFCFDGCFAATMDKSVGICTLCSDDVFDDWGIVGGIDPMVWGKFMGAFEGGMAREFGWWDAFGDAGGGGDLEYWHAGSDDDQRAL